MRLPLVDHLSDMNDLDGLTLQRERARGEKTVPLIKLIKSHDIDFFCDLEQANAQTGLQCNDILHAKNELL
jgi:myosin-crossreactive antigen